MCGIFGFAFVGEKSSNNSTFQNTARNTFCKLAVLNMDRGTHSTGVAKVGSNGNVRIYKKPVPALDLVFRTKWQETSTPSSESPIIIGHTRFATHGEKTQKNSHPFVFDNIVGAHNGIISGLHSFNYPNDLEVDSAQFFWAVSQYGFDEVIKKVYGSINTVFVDLKDPSKLHFTRINNELSIILNRKHGWLAWSSAKRHLFSAVNSLIDNPKHCELIDLDHGFKDYHLVFNLADGHLTKTELDMRSGYSSGQFACGSRSNGKKNKNNTKDQKALIPFVEISSDQKPNAREGCIVPYRSVSTSDETGETLVNCEGELFVGGEMHGAIKIDSKSDDDMRFDLWLKNRSFINRGDGVYTRDKEEDMALSDEEVSNDTDISELNEYFEEFEPGDPNKTPSIEELQIFHDLDDSDKNDLIENGFLKIAYPLEETNEALILVNNRFIKVKSINSMATAIDQDDTDRYIEFVRSNELKNVLTLTDVFIADADVLRGLDHEKAFTKEGSGSSINHCDSCFGAFAHEVPMYLVPRKNSDIPDLNKGSVLCPACFEVLEQFEQAKLDLKEV